MKCVNCLNSFEPKIHNQKTCCKKCAKDIKDQYKKEWNQKNSDYIKKKNREFKENNSDYFSDYYIKNKQKIKQKNKEYYNDNSEDIKLKTSEYQKKNKTKISQNRKQRKKQDISYKIECSLRARLSKAIKSQNGTKAYKTIELLGCTGLKLKEYLESKFQEDMTWDNYGFGNDKWHIDHIIPCDFFDLTNLDEQKKCFSYTNLQPLWQKDNLKKGNKLNFIVI